MKMLHSIFSARLAVLLFSISLLLIFSGLRRI